MIFDIVSFSIGGLSIGLIWFLTIILFKIFKTKKESKSLPQLKSYVKEAHNHMVESANNLIKLYEVFNEIEQSK